MKQHNYWERLIETAVMVAGVTCAWIWIIYFMLLAELVIANA